MALQLPPERLMQILEDLERHPDIPLSQQAVIQQTGRADRKMPLLRKLCAELWEFPFPCCDFAVEFELSRYWDHLSHPEHGTWLT
jgi:hypothetical protein